MIATILYGKFGKCALNWLDKMVLPLSFQRWDYVLKKPLS
jgi:hypothetical protein